MFLQCLAKFVCFDISVDTSMENQKRTNLSVRLKI